MSNVYFYSLLLVAATGALKPVMADEPRPTTKQIESAARKGLSLLQKSSAEYLKHRQCFSCHHQALPMLALTTAQSRGFDVSKEHIDAQVKHTTSFLAKNRDNYLKGQGQGGQADTAGYALWCLEMAGVQSNETIQAVAEYLLQRDKSHNHWRPVSRRPPSEASPFTTTYLGVRGLQTFATAELKDRAMARIERAGRWLVDTAGTDTEERVFRLWALKLVGADAKIIETAKEELIKSQNKDGGWRQIDKLESDAYATGSALVALHQAGGVGASESLYQRGLKFLIASQKEDGSWLVTSRSKPFQTYFESGFPHGKDQFISIAASSWATTALALALPAKKKTLSWTTSK